MATKQTTKPKPAAQAKPAPKMIKLASGGERPETAGDRRAMALMKKAEARKPDGAKAFGIASDMEDPLRTIERLMHALYMIAGSEAVSGDRHLSDGLFAIAIGMEEPLDEAQAKREKIFHLTWGYKFAAQPEAPAATVADIDKTIASLKAARARAKQAARAAS
jgi:hypothetical protein